MALPGNQLVGDTIHPLNILRHTHPALYEQHRAKYAHRFGILDYYFPPLGCYWSDVVFLSAIHPETVCETIARYAEQLIPSCSYWEIPVKNLDKRRLAVWWHLNRDYDPREVQAWDSALVPTLKRIPEKAIQYYRSCQGKQTPYWFVFVPHVLYRGSINVRRYKRQQTNAYLPANHY